MQVVLEAETSSVLFAEWGSFGSCVENVRFWHAFHSPLKPPKLASKICAKTRAKIKVSQLSVFVEF
jgi:hypothetical protein